ncbi:hypothetical protein LZ30DRAFT_729914 [Colletotrichum cereale]|nr:hypothetical protein LZ30DRAFT_729914 [Colletotrichum cereale]
MWACDRRSRKSNNNGHNQVLGAKHSFTPVTGTAAKVPHQQTKFPMKFRHLSRTLSATSLSTDPMAFLVISLLVAWCHVSVPDIPASQKEISRASPLSVLFAEYPLPFAPLSRSSPSRRTCMYITWSEFKALLYEPLAVLASGSLPTRRWCISSCCHCLALAG